MNVPPFVPPHIEPPDEETVKKIVNMSRKDNKRTGQVNFFMNIKYLLAQYGYFDFSMVIKKLYSMQSQGISVLVKMLISS